MSRKSTGPTFIVPGAPVVSFSPDMESCYECLHRAVTRSIQIPESIDSIIGIVRQLKSLYYPMRDYLEADFGISRAVGDALPEPDITDLLKILYAWENDAVVGLAEYRARDTQITAAPLYTDPTERFLNDVDCWKQYRLWMFESTRMVRVARTRIAADAPFAELRRYDWL